MIQNSTEIQNSSGPSNNTRGPFFLYPLHDKIREKKHQDPGEDVS